MSEKIAALEAEIAELKEALEKSRKSDSENRERYYEQQKKIMAYQRLVRYIISELAVGIVTQLPHEQHNENLRELIWTLQGFSPSLDTASDPF